MFLLKEYGIFCINTSNDCLCTYFYKDPTISSTLPAEYKTKIKKTISILILIQESTVLIEKRIRHLIF